METMCGAETKGKATHRLSYLGIHPIKSHQTLTGQWMTEVHTKRSLIWLSPERPSQTLTFTEADASSQLLD